MRFRLFVFLLAVMTFGVIGCARESRQPPSAETAFNEMWDVLDEIEAPEARVPILETFVADYPNTDQSINAMRDVVHYRTVKLDDLPGAMETVRRTQEQTEDPELRFEIGLLLHDLSHQAGEVSDLGAVADELAAHRELGFVDHLDVVEVGEKSGAWELMLKHATAMGSFANEAAFRAAYPDDDFTEDQLTHSVNRRRSWVLAYQGGALTRLGRLEEAEEVFREAEEVPAVTDFVGIPETPLDIYRGQAALLLGQPERAAELFAHDALMGGDPRAVEGLREAYLAAGGEEEGLDDYLRATREQIARPLGSVTLANYAGEPVDLASMTGSVMVISFWNPG